MSIALPCFIVFIARHCGSRTCPPFLPARTRHGLESMVRRKGNPRVVLDEKGQDPLMFYKSTGCIQNKMTSGSADNLILRAYHSTLSSPGNVSVAIHTLPSRAPFRSGFGVACLGGRLPPSTAAVFGTYDAGVSWPVGR